MLLLLRPQNRRSLVTSVAREPAEYCPRPKYDWLYVCAVFAVFALALALRLGGIQHGEPFKIHVDEPNFVRRSLGMLANFDLNLGGSGIRAPSRWIAWQSSTPWTPSCGVNR